MTEQSDAARGRTDVDVGGSGQRPGWARPRTTPPATPCLETEGQDPPPSPSRSRSAESPEEQQAEEGWYLDLLEWETGLLWQQIALTL